jgi:hypothetical protein
MVLTGGEIHRCPRDHGSRVGLDLVQSGHIAGSEEALP